MPDTLEATGEALYGVHWRHQLAEALGLRLRSVQRWLDGSAPVPAGVWQELLTLVDNRRAALDRVHLDLIKMVNDENKP